MNLSHLPGGPHVFENAALVCGMSMVFSPDLQQAITPAPFDSARALCEEEVARRLLRRVEDGRVSFDFAKPPEMMGRLAAEVIPLNLLHPQNYFHFLIEWLPGVAALLADGRAGERSMIASGLLHPNMWQALRILLGRRQLPILQLKLNQAIACDTVLQPRPSYHAAELIGGGVTTASFDRQNLDVLRQAFRPLWSEPQARGRKLYVRRVSPVRNLVNSAEVEALARTAGFEVVDPAQLSFVQQVKLFSQASQLAGPTGAWVANLAFVPEGAKVTVFHSELTRAERSHWGPLGDIFGLQLTELYGPVPKVWDRHAIHSDYLVPLDELRTRLAS